MVIYVLLIDRFTLNMLYDCSIVNRNENWYAFITYHRFESYVYLWIWDYPPSWWANAPFKNNCTLQTSNCSFSLSLSLFHLQMHINTLHCYSSSPVSCWACIVITGPTRDNPWLVAPLWLAALFVHSRNANGNASQGLFLPLGYLTTWESHMYSTMFVHRYLF